jgi:glycosyltransferase involved in cell wall biosynthesis
MKLCNESVSVVIPLYNKAPFISRAINSVMLQKKLPREIIVIDDGSTDGGGEIVSQMNNPLIRLVQQVNKGVSVARNVGISLAKGELIAFLDADDEWKPGFLEAIHGLRELYPQAGAYATAFEKIDHKGRRNTKKCKGISSSPGKHYFINNLFSFGVTPPLLWTSAVVVPKIVFNKVGYFKEGEQRGQDIDMWIRIGIHYPIAFNSTILATYRHDATERISRIIPFDHEPAFSITIDNVINSNMLPQKKMHDLKEYGAYYRYAAVRQLIINKNKELSINILNKTRGTKRFYQQGWILWIFAYLPPSYMKYAIRLYNRFFLEAKIILKNLIGS